MAYALARLRHAGNVVRYHVGAAAPLVPKKLAELCAINPNKFAKSSKIYIKCQRVNSILPKLIVNVVLLNKK
jgi:hypothetical protein